MNADRYDDAIYVIDLNELFLHSNRSARLYEDYMDRIVVKRVKYMTNNVMKTQVF